VPGVSTHGTTPVAAPLDSTTAPSGEDGNAPALLVATVGVTCGAADADGATGCGAAHPLAMKVTVVVAINNLTITGRAIPRRAIRNRRMQRRTRASRYRLQGSSPRDG